MGLQRLIHFTCSPGGSTSGRTEPPQAPLARLCCCRLIWPLLVDDRLRRAVEVAEAFADGLASASDLAQAREPAHALGPGGG